MHARRKEGTHLLEGLEDLLGVKLCSIARHERSEIGQQGQLVF